MTYGPRCYDPETGTFVEVKSTNWVDALREAKEEIDVLRNDNKRLRKALDQHHIYCDWERGKDGVLYYVCNVCGKHTAVVEEK